MKEEEMILTLLFNSLDATVLAGQERNAAMRPIRARFRMRIIRSACE